jgi:rare lipoprotein A
MINFKNLFVLALLNTCFLTTVAAQKTKPAQYGNAVLYSKKLCGKATANGGKLNCDALTAAHRKLPFGTKIRVTNVKNDKSIIVKINDRGPYSKKDILDLSPKAAKMIGLTMRNGRIRVRIDVVSAKS